MPHSVWNSALCIGVLSVPFFSLMQSALIVPMKILLSVLNLIFYRLSRSATDLVHGPAVLLFV